MPTSNTSEQYFSTDHVKSNLAGRTARGGAVAIVSQGLKFVITIAATSVMARLLTPNDYGLIGMVAFVTGLAVDRAGHRGRPWARAALLDPSHCARVLRALDVQLQEVGRARDARVVVADGSLAQPGEFGLGALSAIEPGLDHPAQILLDGALVLGGRRDDAGVGDTACVVERVAVVEQAAWRLRGAVPDAGPGGHISRTAGQAARTPR